MVKCCTQNASCRSDILSVVDCRAQYVTGMIVLCSRVGYEIL